jgi:hypothetical protein
MPKSLSARLFSLSLLALGLIGPQTASALLPPPPPPPREWPGETQGVANAELYALFEAASRDAAASAKERIWDRLPEAALAGAPALWRSGEPHAELTYFGIFLGTKTTTYRFGEACEDSEAGLQSQHCANQIVIVEDFLRPFGPELVLRIQDTFDPEATAAAALPSRVEGQPPNRTPELDALAAAKVGDWVLSDMSRTAVFDARTCPALQDGLPGPTAVALGLFPVPPEPPAAVPPRPPPPPLPGRHPGPLLTVSHAADGVAVTLTMDARDGASGGLLASAQDLSREVLRTCEPVAVAGRAWARPEWLR